MSHPSPDKCKDVLDLSRDPVKHFVRVHGWLQAANSRFAKLETQGAQREYGLRYLTLCGKDGIDIFLFKRASIIKDNGRGFPSVFYCESYGGNFVQVRELLGKSRSYLGNFEDLVNKNWFRDFVIANPFDVVNLDFSGSCFPRADQPFSGTLRSVTRIIELQKGNEFDLFITFKALRSVENNAAITELVLNMEKNFEQSDEIEEKFRIRFGNLAPEDMLEQDYGKFLLTTFPKIVFGFGSSNGYVVKCPQKFIYRRTDRRGTNYQIVKFIFSFENLGHSHSFSGASRRTAELAAHYKESTLDDFDILPLDVDNEVMGNNALKDELEKDSKSILESRKAFGT
jgi:hypothetical protein